MHFRSTCKQNITAAFQSGNVSRLLNAPICVKNSRIALLLLWLDCRWSLSKLCKYFSDVHTLVNLCTFVRKY